MRWVTVECHKDARAFKLPRVSNRRADNFLVPKMNAIERSNAGDGDRPLSRKQIHAKMNLHELKSLPLLTLSLKQT